MGVALRGQELNLRLEANFDAFYVLKRLNIGINRSQIFRFLILQVLDVDAFADYFADEGVIDGID